MKNKSFEEQIRLYKEIAIHYGKDRTVQQLARELGLTKVEVSAAAYKLRKSGIDIPLVRSKTGIMGIVVTQLSTEHPELLRLKKGSMPATDRISRILAERSA